MHVASAQVLLAMTIQASSPSRDALAKAFVCNFLKLSSVDQAIEVSENYYLEYPLPARALSILLSIFQGADDTSPSFENLDSHFEEQNESPWDFELS